MSAELQKAKQVVLDFHDALDRAELDQVESVLGEFTSDDWLWRGMHPFDVRVGAHSVAEAFWKPLRHSFAPLQRRPDIFLAGTNDVEEHHLEQAASEEDTAEVHPQAGGTTAGESESSGFRRTPQGRSEASRGTTASAGTWVCEMGHLLGLFDKPWLDIPPTRQMCFHRYAEFNHVRDDGVIDESAMFIDIVSVMRQAGQYPFPPPTGSLHVHPGPRTHDGLLYGEHDPADGAATMDLVNAMIGDLLESNIVANETGRNVVSRETMARSWTEDMIWSGPDGIGATYTIDRYQQQHQYPFRCNLTDKQFNGHVARFAEGDYACFFGWANLTNTPTGGFMGMPASGPGDMRVVDVYRREGDKLAENWIFIDMLHWLSMQGLDVLARMRQLLGLKEFGT